jgi:DNA-binding transcriptional LysR family regulator
LKFHFSKAKMKTINFDIDALRTMVVGVDLGGFSRAALRLHRSPSAVSMQLRKLEAQAGQRLFRRSGRGLSLTEAGDVLLRYARRVLALNDEMGAAVGAIADGGTVRVGMPQDFAHAALQTLLARYARVCPATYVEVRAGRNYELADDVKSGRLDLALAFAAAGKGTGQRVATVPAVWIGRARRPDAASAERITPLVVFDGPCLFRDMAIDSLTRAGLPWRLTMMTPSLAGLWCGVRAGLGFTVRTALEIPAGLAIVPPGAGLPALPPVDVVLYCEANRPAPVQHFRDLLLEVVGECVAAPGPGPRRRRAAARARGMGAPRAGRHASANGHAPPGSAAR